MLPASATTSCSLSLSTVSSTTELTLIIGGFAPVTEHDFVRLWLFLNVLLSALGKTQTVKAVESGTSSKEDCERLLSGASDIGTDTEALRGSIHEAVDNFLEVLRSPSRVFCCVNPQVRLNRSDTSAIATLMSEDELPESSCAEFFLERGSGAASQGQTSSDVEAPATMDMLGFFTLHADSG